MTNRNPTLYRTERIPQTSWLKRMARVCLIALLVVCLSMLLSLRAHAGEVRAAVVNDPASARSADVKPLIRDDLHVYLSGGKSALGWSMHRVTADKLAADYRANEVAAQRLYGDDADIVITGRVAQVAITFQTPRIMFDSTVNAFMVKGKHDDWLASLTPRQVVTVACRRVRSAVSLVAGYECEPRAAYIARMTDVYFYSMHGLAKQGDRMAAKLVEIASK